MNAIKKLRGITQLESPSPVKTETITKVAVTKTLSSGAVLVSTKSPAKQQPAVSERDQFTGNYMLLDNFVLFQRRDVTVVRTLAFCHCGLGSLPGPCIRCGLVLVLALRVILWFLQFNTLHKNQHSKFQFDLDVHSLCNLYAGLSIKRFEVEGE